jgi:hypothetical protein
MDDDPGVTVARIRRVRARFAEAHREVLYCLKCGDFERLSSALEQERQLLEEQQQIVEDYRISRPG